MLNFLKPKVVNEASRLVDELAHEEQRSYILKDSYARARILNAAPQVQRRVVLSMIAWLNSSLRLALTNKIHTAEWKMRQVLVELLKQKLPFVEADLIILLDWSVSQHHNAFRCVPQMIRVCGDYLKENALTGTLSEAVERLIQVIGEDSQDVEYRRWMLNLHELMGVEETQLPFAMGDAWADVAVQEIGALPIEKQNAWAELLACCLRASGPFPGTRWLKETDRILEKIGQADFSAALLRWLAFFDQPRQNLRGMYDNEELPLPVNVDLLKGLIWRISRIDSPDLARALATLAISAYRKIPQRGPRAAKVGNACFWALGNMPGPEGIAQLSILKLKIKMNSAQKLLDGTLQRAAQRLGMTADEVEELSVPTYGLDSLGTSRFVFGDVVCEMRVDGINVIQSWLKNGRQVTAMPKSVREQYPAELKEIAGSLKDLRRMLPAQRDRIENLYLLQKKWSLGVWRVRNLEHPLLGSIARRLIWKFSKGERAASGIWLDGSLVGQDDQPLEWLDDETTVELWHPLDVDTQVVLAWREWLMRHEVCQPFKQAHREIYLLTDAERTTNTYSNRYAAHVLRQHQFNALCAARGWRNSLRLLVDAELPPALKTLPAYGLRAEYWVEGIGTNYPADTNASGTFLYLSTDQVRFYRMDAATNYAHAGGGGYHVGDWRGTGQAEPLPLEQIPALVLSEIFRDVDLFVGVASVGNDPTWLDGGGETRYLDYWHSFSFGELGESAKTRRQLLEMLLPRLKIAERCSLTDKFLVVRGDLRTYKIHLGSSNIMMEPNDQYLCIVPMRGTESGRDKLFLPFDGDPTLSVILSKAFMLAEDRNIRDPSITRQINA